MTEIQALFNIWWKKHHPEHIIRGSFSSSFYTHAESRAYETIAWEAWKAAYASQPATARDKLCSPVS